MRLDSTTRIFACSFSITGKVHEGRLLVIGGQLGIPSFNYTEGVWVTATHGKQEHELDQRGGSGEERTLAHFRCS